MQKLIANTKRRYTKRGSKLIKGYAANLINISPSPLNIPSVVDKRNIKSSLSPFFTHNK